MEHIYVSLILLSILYYANDIFKTNLYSFLNLFILNKVDMMSINISDIQKTRYLYLSTAKQIDIGKLTIHKIRINHKY